MVEPDDGLVPWQHEPGGAQRALEADRVAVRRGDDRRRRERRARACLRGRVRAALLVVVRSLVDPRVRRPRCRARRASCGRRRTARACPAASGSRGTRSRCARAPAGARRPPRTPPRLSGSTTASSSDCGSSLTRTTGSAPLLHRGQPVAAQRLADDDQAVDRAERHRGVEDGLVRVPLPVQAGRVRLHRHHPVAGGASCSCDPGDQCPEVEPADHRRQDADRSSRRRGDRSTPHCSHDPTSLAHVVGAEMMQFTRIGRHTR